MTALALASDPSILDQAEAEFLRDVLLYSRFERNQTYLPQAKAHPAYRSAADLAQRGFGVIHEHQIAPGVRSAKFSVSVDGARALVALGMVTVAELALDVGRLLDQLAGYRRVIAANQALGWTELNPEGWEWVRLEPFSRVAAAILIRDGLAEQREPRTEQERERQDIMILRATDKGVAR